MLLLLLLILRILMSPLDVRIGAGPAYGISLLAPILGILLLYALELRADRNKEFELEEYMECGLVALVAAIPLGWTLYAIMLIGILAGWMSHITGKHW